MPLKEKEYANRAAIRSAKRQAFHQAAIDPFTEQPCEGRRNDGAGYGNIMADPRIWRGHIYDIYKKPKSLRIERVEGHHVGGGPVQVRKQSPGDLKIRKKKHFVNTHGRGDQCSGTAPTLLLDVICDRPLEIDNSRRIELKRIRPYSPPFTPATTFRAASTTIGHLDLFIFDREARAIVEVLVGEALEQGLLETLQEEERTIAVEERKAFTDTRNVFRAESQRHIDLHRRYSEERASRRAERIQHVFAEEAKLELQTLQQLAKECVEDVVPDVYLRMQEEELFYDPIPREMKSHFIPWLNDETLVALDDLMAIALITQVLVREALAENRRELGMRKKEALRSSRMFDRQRFLASLPPVIPVISHPVEEA